MKIRKLEGKDTSLRFVLERTTPALANALRRTLVADIPKMAIEDVEFHLGPIRDEEGKEYESVAPLFDEIVAHRLGLLPLPTDLDLFTFRASCEACGGEGCPNCTIIYAINRRGPATVYSGDLEPIGDPKLKPTDPKIPILKLGEGQAILVYATAVLGTGREHAKWQVAHGVGYEYYPMLEVDGKKVDGLKAKAPPCRVHLYPKTDEKIDVEPDDECAACQAFVKAHKGKRIRAWGDPTRALFHFETDGSMTAATALRRALDILETRFRELAAQAAALS
jgi:DNA-directed RNA polymerase subunit D